ncbi:MAG TPA: hypothetical protein DF699_01065, partial [Phycisphaerales bacterium]|nr:hypothetical protein [Phycisphaerales bacterium]
MTDEPKTTGNESTDPAAADNTSNEEQASEKTTKKTSRKKTTKKSTKKTTKKAASKKTTKKKTTKKAASKKTTKKSSSKSEPADETADENPADTETRDEQDTPEVTAVDQIDADEPEDDSAQAQADDRDEDRDEDESSEPSGEASEPARKTTRKRSAKRSRKSSSSSEDSQAKPTKRDEKQPRTEMIVNYVPGEECRIAMIEDGKLEEFMVEPTDKVSRVGNIYVGRVANIEPAIQAAFVDFGTEENGFLHISDLRPQYFAKGDDKTERVGKKTPRRSRPP